MGTVKWPALYNVLWREHRLRDDDEVHAFEVSVSARITSLGRGEIAVALNTIAERQRCQDPLTRKGPPSASQVVTEIQHRRNALRAVSPQGSVSMRAARLEDFNTRIRQATDHRARWDLICEAGNSAAGGSLDDCAVLHAWVCQQYPDFPRNINDVPAAWKFSFRREEPEEPARDSQPDPAEHWPPF